ncbi:MAG: hypothetical protein Q8L48_37915 [Archangium sp.]|nr:hypothetical protein [Archangium sp.]
MGPLLLLFGWQAFLDRRKLRWKRLLRQGHEARNAERMARALELYLEAGERAPQQPQNRLCVGATRLYLWQLAAARRDLELSLTLRPLGQDEDAPLRAVAMPMLALLDGLDGRVGRARERLDTLDPGADSSLVALAEAVIACREQRWVDAGAFARDPEVLALGSTIGALARTLDSWSLAEQGGPLQLVDQVALFSEASPDELRAAWPELFAFLDRAPKS